MLSRYSRIRLGRVVLQPVLQQVVGRHVGAVAGRDEAATGPARGWRPSPGSCTPSAPDWQKRPTRPRRGHQRRQARVQAHPRVGVDDAQAVRARPPACRTGRVRPVAAAALGPRRRCRRTRRRPRRARARPWRRTRAPPSCTASAGTATSGEVDRLRDVGDGGVGREPRTPPPPGSARRTAGRGRRSRRRWRSSSWPMRPGVRRRRSRRPTGVEQRSTERASLRCSRLPRPRSPCRWARGRTSRWKTPSS